MDIDNINMDDSIDTQTTANRTILNLKTLGIKEVLAIGRYSYSKSYRKLTPEVFKHCYALIYIEKGEQIYRINNEKVLLKGGQIMIIRPYEVYATEKFFENRGKVYWIIGDTKFNTFLDSPHHVGKQIIETLLQSPSRLFDVSLSFEVFLKDIFKVYSEIRKDKLLNIEKLKKYIFLLYCEIYSQCNDVELVAYNAYDWRIKKSIDYINQHKNENINIKFLAHQVANMSFPHFLKLFKKSTSHTPLDYINLLKIEDAKILLEKNRNITKVSRNLGFSSSQYFATVFKKYVGYTPSKFLKNNF